MRKFGVEVEFAGSREAAVAALRQAGIRAELRNGHQGHGTDSWYVKTDGSVMNGGEMVSPPLDFDSEADREQVSAALRALAASGAQTTAAAGVHVHVDAGDLTARQIGAVAMNFCKFEDVLYRIASSGWASIRAGVSTYARPYNDQMKTGIARARTERSLFQAYGAGHSSRYHGLNLHSWATRRTIEFRVFNTTLNPERLQAYIAIAVGMVQDARVGKRRSMAKAYKMGDMAAGRVPEKSAYLNFYNMLRYGAGLDLVDMRRIARCWKDSRPQNAVAGSYY